MKSLFNITLSIVGTGYIINKFFKLFINKNEEVYKLNPQIGKYYKVTENAHYSKNDNKYYSTYRYPLKYVGICTNNIENYNLFDNNNQEIKIKKTEYTCYVEVIKLDGDENYDFHLLFN
jgi:hypothetical protein